jgi:hypothetical protein
VLLPVAAPPVLDRINGKLGSLSGGSDSDVACVAANVVNSVGERHAIGVGGEIVIFDLAGFAPPGPTTIFVVADELALLAIDAEMGRSAVSNFRRLAAISINCRLRLARSPCLRLKSDSMQRTAFPHVTLWKAS